ncbi:uncharacterized protein LOC133304340 [Gastrolobium bilobum]|uniref:uncharacterized protein LOC133304340 n=1 Tax=Gastrolobium bilobum TaxID=150636 RepID=UPI002AB067BB|nr:uncharacterized protein LOC133304340 [Gastrolobium bilobum]
MEEGRTYYMKLEAYVLNEWLNVLQSVQIPFALIPLLCLMSKEQIMGSFKIGSDLKVWRPFICILVTLVTYQIPNIGLYIWYVKRKHLIDVSEVFRVLNAEKKFRIASYNCLQLLKSMGKDKQKSIDVFFKKKLVSESESSDALTNIISESDAPSHEQPPSKCRRIEHTDDIITVKNKNFERDTGKRCSFRGHDETIDSRNRGNFIEMIKLLASYNEKVADVVLKNAPLTAKYTSPQIQKEILYVLENKVRKQIRKDIGDSKFCIIVDEARDESKREQMALNICGQGYDGASNMCGEWNGLQALFVNECPCAYYVHCFAHRLQLAWIAASKEFSSIYQFFQNLNFIINIITASSKRHDQFQAAQISEFERLQTIGELETGTGSNQVGTLKRASDTRWGSHFYSICSLQRGYNESCSVLEKIRREGSNYSQREDATAAYKMITSFEFIFTLLLMKEIMGITEILCQALQQKSQDILNAMQLVSSTKELIQELRDDGWKRILESVVNFSKLHEIDVPDLNAQYIEGRGRRQHDQITIEHHYHFDIFNSTIDFQLQELNIRFTEQTTELLSLSSSLDPKNGYKALNVDDICSLAEKYYPLDFSEQERINLNCQLKHFHKDIPKHPELQNLSSISELCQGLAKTGKSNSYHLVDRLIRLILTLPVSTANGERAFSAMKIVKTRLRNKMDDEFLANNLVVYVERDIAETFTTDSILEDFVNLKERRLQF